MNFSGSMKSSGSLIWEILRPLQQPKIPISASGDVMTDLLNNQVTAIVLGGTQDITRGIFMAYEQQDIPDQHGNH